MSKQIPVGKIVKQPNGWHQWDGQQWVPMPPDKQDAMNKSKRQGRVTLLLIGLCLVAGVVVVQSLGAAARDVYRVPVGSQGNAPAQAPAITTDWIPTGFTESTDPGLAWRWNDKGEPDCSYHDSCADVEVVARDGCPGGVFVEMAVVDNTGTLGENSNDIGPALGPMGRAIITVGWMDSSDNQVTVTRMSCL